MDILALSDDELSFQTISSSIASPDPIDSLAPHQPSTAADDPSPNFLKARSWVWDHGNRLNDKGRQYWKCKYCIITLLIAELTS
jgi:hypothetical protein